MNKYRILVYWSIENNSFIAEVPELSGCMTDEQTYAEVIKNAEIIIDEWIETAELMERAVPEI